MQGVSCRVFLRSFFLETVWNNLKLQNIGFTYCIIPVLERLYPDPDQRKEAICRHLSTVNTHPAMAPLLIGVLANLERGLSSKDAVSYRKSLMATFASQGDRIFWGHVRPLAAILGVLMGLCFFGTLVGSIAALLVYNTPQLILRGFGFSFGWQKGLDILSFFRSWRLEAAITGVRSFTSLALGALAGLLVILCVKDPAVAKTGSVGVGVLGLGLVLTSALIMGLRRKVRAELLVCFGVICVTFMLLLSFQGK